MKKILLAAALAASCGLASAQGYVGALVGLTSIAFDCGPGQSCDDSDTGFKLYGGYEVAPNISIEVGYTDFGKAKVSEGADRAEYKGTALSLVGAFRVAFTPEFTGVARLGLASVKGKFSDSLGASASDSNIKLYTGLGVEYAMSKDIKLVGAFDLTNVEIDGQSGTAYIAGVGAQIGF
ncbi:MAG: outer membrane beta-barrel protein [Aquabacterium sp.]|nr:outer membrane beta-barrel protein [Aquabacterium sp.]